MNNPLIHTDPDGRSVDNEFKQQKDGSYKKISNKGGATSHTFFSNNGDVTLSNSQGTYTVNPQKQARGLKAYSKRIAKIKKNVGPVVEYTGTAVKYGGLISTAFGNPAGPAIAKGGQAIELVGVGIQVGQDIKNKDIVGAGKKIAMEVAGFKGGKVVKKFLDGGLDAGSTAAKSLNVVKEVNIDAVKKAVSEIDK